MGSLGFFLFLRWDLVQFSRIWSNLVEFGRKVPALAMNVGKSRRARLSGCDDGLYAPEVVSFPFSFSLFPPFADSVIAWVSICLGGRFARGPKETPSNIVETSKILLFDVGGRFGSPFQSLRLLETTQAFSLGFNIMGFQPCRFRWAGQSPVRPIFTAGERSGVGGTAAKTSLRLFL